MWNKFKTLDPWLYILPILLGIAGVASIYSITYSYGANIQIPIIQTTLPLLAVKQSIFVLAGVIVMVIATFIDYRTLKGWSFWLYLFSLILLASLAFLPDNSSLIIQDFGAKRWLNLFGFQFQPSELMKITLLILLATIFSRFYHRMRGRVLILAAILVLIPLFLILIQPDLGTALIIFLASTITLVGSNLNLKQWLTIAIIFLIILTSIVLSYYQVKPFKSLLKDYQRERVETFLNPDKDPKQKGYNILQAIIAVGSGGVLGKGLGFGSQSQLHFLPVAHSDFIFASLAESWGFVGALSVIIIYGILLSRIIMAMNIAKDRFGLIICIGVFSILLFQITINIGMNVKLFPVTGTPLPLLSYGGTSILSTFFSLGIIQSIVLRYKKINF